MVGEIGTWKWRHPDIWNKERKPSSQKNPSDHLEKSPPERGVPRPPAGLNQEEVMWADGGAAVRPPHRTKSDPCHLNLVT